METKYMAIDQHGQTEHNLGEHPRKTLMERYNVKSAQKMYIDLPLDKAGDRPDTFETVHVGWIVAGHWFTVYEVKRMENRTESADLFTVNDR